jgi:hypothetical protein
MNARKAPRGAFRAFGDAKQVMEDVAEALTGYALPVTLKDRQLGSGGRRIRREVRLGDTVLITHYLHLRDR